MTFLLVAFVGLWLVAAAVYAVTLFVLEPLGLVGDRDACDCRQCRGCCAD